MAGVAELDRHRYLSLATFRQSGAEVATPVWFAAAGGKLYVFTGGESGKVKRLRRSPRAKIAPSDARGRVRGEWHEALRSKYGWQMWLADVLARLGGRLGRRAWIEIEL